MEPIESSQKFAKGYSFVSVIIWMHGYPVRRFRNSNHMLVIPGRREAASPESITTGRGVWIPGSPPSVAPRNDAAAHMIGFMESLYWAAGSAASATCGGSHAGVNVSSSFSAHANSAAPAFNFAGKRARALPLTFGRREAVRRLRQNDRTEFQWENPTHFRSTWRPVRSDAKPRSC